MSYDDFRYQTDGSADGQITSWSHVDLPVRALDNPANVYVRVAGIARAFQGDPSWEVDTTYRGTVVITSDPILDPDDVLIGWCGNVGFARIDHDDSSGDSADFGLAVDEVTRVDIAAGKCSIRFHAAFEGDSEIVTASFSADLLIYRPSLAT